MRQYAATGETPPNKTPDQSGDFTQATKDRIEELKANNATIKGVTGALSLAGGVYGVILSNRAGRSFWWGVGSFFAGSILVGTLGTVATLRKVNNNTAQINNLGRKLK